MKSKFKRRIRKLISPIRKIGLNNKDISIISNNCWGGYIYDIYGLKYLSPTIGLWFFSDDYIKFISNLEYYLSVEAKVLNIEHSRHKDYFDRRKMNNVMLANIDDVEIVFVHYESAEIGVKKWNYRRKRVNFSNLLIKYNDQNCFKEEFLRTFDNIKYRKVFFTSNKNYLDRDYSVYFDCYKDEKYVLDDIKTSAKYINYKKLLNKKI